MNQNDSPSHQPHSADDPRLSRVLTTSITPNSVHRSLGLVNSYKIIRLISEGGMGAVYEAEQAHTQRSVALKLIRADQLSDEMREGFINEFRILGRLKHPGIARLYEAGETDPSAQGSQPFFTMELVKGSRLTQYADEKRLSIGDRVKLMIKVLEAIHYAHQENVVHLDLKPSNILVDDGGQPKILDFGVARTMNRDHGRLSEAPLSGLLGGTDDYMSPEQINHDQQIDPRSDVFTLGAITYKLLEAQLPYQTRREGRQIIRDEGTRMLRSIRGVTLRGDLEMVIGKALEMDKARRYQSAQGFANDLQGVTQYVPYDVGGEILDPKLHTVIFSIWTLLALAVVIFSVLALIATLRQQQVESQPARAT